MRRLINLLFLVSAVWIARVEIVEGFTESPTPEPVTSAPTTFWESGPVITSTLDFFTPFLSEQAVVDSFNISSYMGNWYEVASNSLVRAFIEIGCACSTATYSNYDSTAGTFDVTNMCNERLPSGTLRVAPATATIVSTGKLTVNFGDSPFAAGDYWIIALGPVVDGMYEWAVVSGRTPVLLFVLARDPDTFWSTYYQEAYAFLKARGFLSGPVRYPIRRYHPETCNYGITASPTASPTEAPTPIEQHGLG